VPILPTADPQWNPTYHGANNLSLATVGRVSVLYVLHINDMLTLAHRTFDGGATWRCLFGKCRGCDAQSVRWDLDGHHCRVR
jgi:hypothetical protein